MSWTQGSLDHVGSKVELEDHLLMRTTWHSKCISGIWLEIVWSNYILHFRIKLFRYPWQTFLHPFSTFSNFHQDPWNIYLKFLFLLNLEFVKHTARKDQISSRGCRLAHVATCSLASLLLIHMSRRGPFAPFFKKRQRWGGTVCCQSPLWKTVTVWGGSCWHLGHPMGVTLGPPRPPALIIDVCRCACLHDIGVHLRSPLQCPSINHTLNWAFHVCMYFQDCVFGPVCVSSYALCVYIHSLRSSTLHYWWPSGRDESVNSSSRGRGRRVGCRRWERLETDIRMPGCIRQACYALTSTSKDTYWFL